MAASMSPRTRVLKLLFRAGQCLQIEQNEFKMKEKDNEGQKGKQTKDKKDKKANTKKDRKAGKAHNNECTNCS